MARENWFYGVRGIHFIWHGEYSDPEVMWHNHYFDYFDLEDTLWCIYREECEREGKLPDANAFPEWVRAHVATARDILQNILDARKEAKKLKNCA